MRKKIVKEESFSLETINTIKLIGDVSDILITQSKSQDLNIIQYSVRKVDSTSLFQTEISSDVLTIQEHSQKVNWFMGIKGNPGVYYEIQLPDDKLINLSIVHNTGNLKIADNKVQSISVEIHNSGNVDLTALNILNDSRIYTRKGNIDIKMDPECNCKVNAATPSGNQNIDNKYSSGHIILDTQSDQGDITAV